MRGKVTEELVVDSQPQLFWSPRVAAGLLDVGQSKDWSQNLSKFSHVTQVVQENLIHRDKTRQSTYSYP